MGAYNIADAKARFSALIERAEEGETVEVLRRGKPVAKIVPHTQPKERIDFAAIDAMVAKQPVQKTRAVDIIREMRDAKY